MPSSTTSVKAANTKLLAMSDPVRLNADCSRLPPLMLPARQATSPTHAAQLKPKNPSRAGPMADSVKECTDTSTPERVKKVPRIVRLKAAQMSDRFQTARMPRLSCAIAECRKAVPQSQGNSEAFSTGSQPQ